MSNDSTLSSSYKYQTAERLRKIYFPCDKILKTIQGLDPQDTHEHDSVSIKMLKLRNPSILKALCLIFRKCLNFSCFSDEK